MNNGAACALYMSWLAATLTSFETKPFEMTLIKLPHLALIKTLAARAGFEHSCKAACGRDFHAVECSFIPAGFSARASRTYSACLQDSDIDTQKHLTDVLLHSRFQ
jgi:hypothetical protein